MTAVINNVLIYLCSSKTNWGDIPEWSKLQISSDSQIGMTNFITNFGLFALLIVSSTLFHKILCSCQTIESSAREFLGNDKSSSLTATVVWIVNILLRFRGERESNNDNIFYFATEFCWPCGKWACISVIGSWCKVERRLPHKSQFVNSGNCYS